MQGYGMMLLATAFVAGTNALVKSCRADKYFPRSWHPSIL